MAGSPAAGIGMERFCSASVAIAAVLLLGACSPSDAVSSESPAPLPTVTLSVAPETVPSGGVATLTWSSANASTCTASGAWSGAKSPGGSQSTGAISANSTFVLSCSGTGGSVDQSATVTLSAAPPPTPTVNLSASPASINSNGTSVLTWTSANATSCTAAGGWAGSRPTAGSQQVGPLTATTTFTLTCTGGGGSAQGSVQVTVGQLGSGSGISGTVDSSLIDAAGDNRVYIFAGSVTPDDDDGDAGDPLYQVPVYQIENSCSFGYQLGGLAPGTYTIAFTSQAQNDRPNLNDSLTFVGTATVAVSTGIAVQDVRPATVLRVGPGRQFSTVQAAAAVAGDGSVIEIDPGEYDDDIVVWRASHLTVRGAGGGRAHIHGTAVIPFVSGDDRRNGKGLWVIQGSAMRVENMEFSGAKVTDGNGAGIRNEGNNLTVCNGYFHDDENGFLGGAYGTLLIEYSEFANNGAGDGQTHNVYVDGGSSPGDQLIFRHNYSHHARVGHTLKTRARENHILYNRIMDEADGTSSYTIDVPEGGLTFVVGNLLQQGPATENSTIMSYGAEGLTSGRAQRLYVVNNTFVNDRGSGTFVSTASGTESVRLINNLFLGGGTLSSGAVPQSTTNLAGSLSLLVGASTFDYRLAPTATAAIDAGTAPGSADGVDLTPAFEYVHPARREARLARGTIDIGAYEKAP